MSTAKRLMHDDKAVGYFENLSKSTQEIVKDCILEAAKDRQGPDGYKIEDECLEAIECRSRDGFIASSHNRGGLVYRNFTTLAEYWGGGYSPAHEGVNNEIKKMIDLSCDDVRDQFIESIGQELIQRYLLPNEINYHGIESACERFEKQGDKENAAVLADWLNKIQELELDNLSDDYSSIMHEIRVMYNGKNSKGLHMASVSAAVNTEGPYHRSSISWAPGLFCEGAKEVEITWRNNSELKRKLTKALKLVSKAIF